MGGQQSVEAAPAATIPPPAFDTRIPLAELVANPDTHKQKIIDCMRENGLITFRLDPETIVRRLTPFILIPFAVARPSRLVLYGSKSLILDRLA